MSSSDRTGSTKAEITLAAYLDGGRLPHAILVEGTSGALSFAKRIAAAALCVADAGKPCGVCKSCVKCERDIHPDLLIYSGGDKARSFHVDAVRELRQEAFIRPNEADGKVFVLDNVQNMTIQAQNALLKIIEEPPSGVTFVLTCENKSALLETVRSRVSVLRVEDGAADEPEVSEFPEKAESVIKNLLYGSELEAMVVFASYERDRPGCAKLLDAIRVSAANRMIAAAKSGQANRDEAAKLMKLIDIADEMSRALEHNASGLLMTAILPARFKLQ